MLHVHCGDSSAGSLRAANPPGEVIVWFDPVWEGPAPHGLSADELLRLRAEYVSETTGWAVTPDQVREKLAGQQRDLLKFRDHEETVLWFDACLFDQAILIRQLDWFSRQDPGDRTLSLICIGEFPGFARFRGLGELMPAQIATLIDKRRPVSAAQSALAMAVRAAFLSPDPRLIGDLLRRDTTALPCLAAAMRRHLQRFPSIRNGLGRLEQEIMTVVDNGAAQPPVIFNAVSDMEETPFFGDHTVWNIINRMSRCDKPAFVVEGPAQACRPFFVGFSMAV